jgi:ribosomal protein S18 acetylase RimI-like enzyme
MDDYIIEEKPPTVEEYQRLRRAVGWPKVDPEATRIGLCNALYSVIARQKDEVVGCGRVVGDRGIYFYIQDIIVEPAHQRKGLGRRIMDGVMRYIESQGRTNSFIGLMAAEGSAGFYTRYGFQERLRNRPGMYQMWGRRAGERMNSVRHGSA